MDKKYIPFPKKSILRLRIGFEFNSRADHFHETHATNASKSIMSIESQGRISYPGLFISDNEMAFESQYAYMFVRVHTVYKLYHTYSKLRWKRFLLSSGCVLIYLSFQSVFANLAWFMLLTHPLSLGRRSWDLDQSRIEIFDHILVKFGPSYNNRQITYGFKMNFL